MRDHEPILELADFDGWFDRDGSVDVPSQNQVSLENAEFQDRFVRTRNAFQVEYAFEGILRVHLYPRVDDATRRLVLGAGGNLYDLSYHNSIPILTVAGMIDFSVLPLFNRIYITPHNRLKGLSGEKVYVYDAGDGTNAARPAAGRAPIAADGALAAVTSAAAGTVDAGFYLIAVAYESKSGFITKYGPETYVQYTAPGNKKIDLSNIPVGPAWVAKRHILVSHIIPVFDGNQDNYELFFADVIENNVDTTKTIDFYESSLVNSADYLLDELEEIPAGLGLGMYSGRMIVYGTAADPGTARLSKKGEPESFSAIDGFIITDPQQGGGLKNALELNNALYLFKSDRTYGIVDNGEEPAHWPGPNIVDGAIGTEIHGILNTGETRQDPANDVVLVLYRTGLYLFDGRYQTTPLSWKIDNYWGSQIPWGDRVNAINFQGVYDWMRKAVYITNPFVTGEILYCDLNRGMTEGAARWSKWSVSRGQFNITTIWIELGQYRPQLYIGGAPTPAAAPTEWDGIQIYNPGQYAENVVLDSGAYIGTALIPLALQTGLAGPRTGEIYSYGSATIAVMDRLALAGRPNGYNIPSDFFWMYRVENSYAAELIEEVNTDTLAGQLRIQDFLILLTSSLAYFKVQYAPCILRAITIFGKSLWSHDPKASKPRA